MPDKRTISTGKAAKFCGVTPDTVLKWIKSGKIHAMRTAGGHYRIIETSIEPFYVAPREISLSEDHMADDSVSYCWEFHAGAGKIDHNCRNCMVFRAKAEKCFLMAGLGSGTGRERAVCAENCHSCDYFKFLKQDRFTVLIVTENNALKQELLRNVDADIEIRFSCCGYDTATVVQHFHPDYIVVDNSMDSARTEEITTYLMKDPRARGAQLVMAVAGTNDAHLERNGVCACLRMPFTAGELRSCLLDLRTHIYGAG